LSNLYFGEYIVNHGEPEIIIRVQGKFILHLRSGVGQGPVFFGEGLILKNFGNGFFNDPVQNFFFKGVPEFPDEYVFGDLAFTKTGKLYGFAILGEKRVVFGTNIVLSNGKSQLNIGMF
jgi:hypothetical protein